MKIELSEQVYRYIQAQLVAGRYRTPEELIADLVRQQEERDAGERQLWDCQRQALIGLLGESSILPSSLPDDGLTNREHDRILYGGET
jgi:Arc/MetJ-type ribon-helix-helix transcriptional regulator